MATMLKPGDRVKGYEIKKLVNQGGFAIAYIARAGEIDVFFKQYTDPTPFYPWFKEYLNYEDDIKNRLDSIKPPEVVSHLLDHFVEEDTYYQVIDLITGKSLRELFDESAENPDIFTDENRYKNASVMMFSMRQIHSQGIVHGDLKPDNVFLEKTETSLGLRAKIIDLDFSFIDGISPPWRNDIGIVGSPGYFSPEHFKQELPTLKSDVFTCGIMLYEIMCGTYPYNDPENDPLSRNCKKPIEINPDLTSEFSDIIYDCLDPDQKGRPSTEEVHKAIGKLIKTGKFPQQVIITSGNQYPMTVFKTTILGRDDCRLFGDDYRFVEDQQFEIIKNDTEQKWEIRGLPGVTNNTRLDGEIVTDKTAELYDGALISIGDLKLHVEIK